jgi:hypothetical protein
MWTGDMATEDGFDVEIDDLETFQKAVQRTSDEFRDGGFQTLAAMGQFSAASGLIQSGFTALTDFWRRHGENHSQATTLLQEAAMGLGALAQGATTVATSYQSGDGAGAGALNRIDGKAIDKLFAPPPKESRQPDSKGPKSPLVEELAKDIKKRLEEGNAANKDGIGLINEGATYWLDPYNGATVVTVPEQGTEPSDLHTSEPERELAPDLPYVDKYDEGARRESIRDALRPPKLS